MKKKILFILNPIAGGIQKDYVVSLIKKSLDYKTYTPLFEYTKKRRHAFYLAKTSIKKNFFSVVAVGGDGTINEVASGLINSKVKLGIIPLGSGNGFASYFNLTSNISKSIQIINYAKSIKVDSCFLNKTPYFNLAGLGFSAKIAKETHLYKKRGLWLYCKKIFLLILQYKSIFYEIKIDTYCTKKKFFLIEIANAQIWGRSFNIAPLANPSDGKLEFCGIFPFPFWKIPILLYQLMTSSINKSPYYFRKKGEKITVKCEKRHAHIDGESILIKKEFIFNIKKNTLNLIIP